VQTTDSEALVTAVAGASAPPDFETAIGDDLVLRYCGLRPSTRTLDLTEQVVLFAVNFPVGIASSVIADVIGQYLRRKRQDVPIRKADITIKEEVESTDRNGNKTTRTRRLKVPVDLRPP